MNPMWIRATNAVMILIMIIGRVPRTRTYARLSMNVMTARIIRTLISAIRSPLEYAPSWKMLKMFKTARITRIISLIHLPPFCPTNYIRYY